MNKLKLFGIGIVVGLLTIFCMASGQSLSTKNVNYGVLVVSAAGGESALATGATTDFSVGIPAPGTTVLGPKDLMGRDGESKYNAVELICYATATADNTAEMTLYGVSVDGPPVRIGTVIWTFGTARHTSTTILWADTCVPTSYHATTLTASDSGNNFVAKLTFDVVGYRYLYAIVHGTATGAATDITVLMRPF